MHDLAWYLGCVENGLDFPGLPGSAGVGTHGGSEDHTAILACQTDHVSLFRFVPVTPFGDTRMPADWTFVIASSGVQADKADSVKDRYNRASNGVRALHAIWNRESGEPAQSLAAALASSPRAAVQLEKWIHGDEMFSADDLRRRLRHFINETGRAPRAAAAFKNADRQALGDLAAESQREAHELLGNQIPETITLAALAREIGAFASSSFGAGFGGSVWAAVPAADAQRFGDAWVRAYAERMPHVGIVDWFAARPDRPPRNPALRYRCKIPAMRRSAWLLPLVLLSFGACSSAPPAPAMPPFQTTANMKELMLNVLDPAVDTIWDAVGTIMTLEGTFEKAPSTDDEWAGVRAGAIQLAESGNLLMLPSRSSGSEEWIAQARALIEASNRAIKAIDAKDKDALFTIGGDIYDVCTNCHQAVRAEPGAAAVTCPCSHSASGWRPPKTARRSASRSSCTRWSSRLTSCFCLLFVGLTVMLDLRLLGLALTQVKVSEMVDRILPWVRYGFAIMVFTGVLLFYAIPVRTYQSVWFRAKVIMLIARGDQHRVLPLSRLSATSRRGIPTSGCHGPRGAPAWRR